MADDSRQNLSASSTTEEPCERSSDPRLSQNERLLNALRGIAANATHCPGCRMAREIAQETLDRYDAAKA